TDSSTPGIDSAPLRTGTTKLTPVISRGSMDMTAGDLSVQVLDSFADALFAEPIPDVNGCALRSEAPRTRRREHAFNGVGELAIVSNRHDLAAACRLHNLAATGIAGHDDRRAAQERFERHQSEHFVLGRVDDHIG